MDNTTQAKDVNQRLREMRKGAQQQTCQRLLLLSHSPILSGSVKSTYFGPLSYWFLGT